MNIGIFELIGWIVILVLAWIISRRQFSKPPKKVSDDYLKGLSYVVCGQSDKAVDLLSQLAERDQEGIGLYFTLGELFRRQGQVERAIRIHENLVAKPQLVREQRLKALLALGEDYLRTGVLDRAERLLIEVTAYPTYQAEALLSLLYLYEQEKEWQKAIEIAERYQGLSKKTMHCQIAQYYCELAVLAQQQGFKEAGVKALRKAVATDKYCIRAGLLEAEYAFAQEEYKNVVKILHEVIKQDPDFIGETLSYLGVAYLKMDKKDTYYTFLQTHFKHSPHPSTAIALSHLMVEKEGYEKTAEFLAEHLFNMPSLVGLQRLATLQSYVLPQNDHHRQDLLLQVIQRIIDYTPGYQCLDCGYKTQIIYWYCPYCRHWGRIKPHFNLER